MSINMIEPETDVMMATPMDPAPSEAHPDSIEVVAIDQVLTSPDATRYDVHYRRLSTPDRLTRSIEMNLLSAPNTSSSLALLTNRHNRYIAIKRGGTQPYTDRTHSTPICKVIHEWDISAAARLKRYQGLIDSIDSMLDDNQYRGHYIGIIVNEDQLYREINQAEGKSFYYKVFADLTGGSCLLKIDVRCSDGQIQTFVSTNEQYPNIRSNQWTQDGVPGQTRSIVINDKDGRSICGWYYITIESRSIASFTLRCGVQSYGTLRSGAGFISRAGPAAGLANTISSHRSVHDRVAGRIAEVQSSAEKRLLLRRRIEARCAQLSAGRRTNLIELNIESVNRYTRYSMEQHRQQWINHHLDREKQVQLIAAQSKQVESSRQSSIEKEMSNRFELCAQRRTVWLRRRSSQWIERKWFMWSLVGLSCHIWINALSAGRTLRQAWIVRTNAAHTIRMFILRHMQRRRYRRAWSSLLSVRTLIRISVVNHQIIIKHRSIDVIKEVLESAAGIKKNLSSIIKNFRHRVIVLQRFHSRVNAVKCAKLRLWSRQWELADKNDQDPVPDRIKQTVLREYMRSARRELVKSLDQWKVDLNEWSRKKKIDDAKRQIIDDGEQSAFVDAPREPRLPILLPRRQLVQLMNDARQIMTNEMINGAQI